MKLIKIALACLMLSGCASKSVEIATPSEPTIVQFAVFISQVGIVYRGIYIKTSTKEYFKAIIPNGDCKGNDVFVTIDITNDDMRARILPDKEVGNK